MSPFGGRSEGEAGYGPTVHDPAPWSTGVPNTVVPVSEDSRPNRRIAPSEAGRQQRLEASKRGASAVQRAFAEPLTRRVFAERIGIHATTLKRWEKQGIVEPKLQTVLGIPTMVYTSADVVFAKALMEVLAANSGLISVRDAAQVVHKNR